MLEPREEKILREILQDRIHRLRKRRRVHDRIQVIALGPAAPQTQARVVSLEADYRASVGSCSTSEPIDDPRRLGLIADPT